MADLPNNVLWELEDRGVDVSAKSLSRDKFDSLSAHAKHAVMRENFKVYDEMQARHFEKLTSMDQAEFKGRGGRVV